MRSVRKRRSESSISVRMRAGVELRHTLPSCHSSATLVAITALSRRPSSALPTISSERPKPYAGAVSIRLMPFSIAPRIVKIDAASSAPPHIQPPIAQVPRPILETGAAMPSMCTVSTFMSGSSAAIGVLSCLGIRPRHVSVALLVHGSTCPGHITRHTTIDDLLSLLEPLLLTLGMGDRRRHGTQQRAKHRGGYLELCLHGRSPLNRGWVSRRSFAARPWLPFRGAVRPKSLNASAVSCAQRH